MNIVSISTSDIGGGAERVAWLLFQAYRARGHHAKLIVGTKRSDNADVIEIPPRRPLPAWWTRVLWTIHGRLSPLERKVNGVATMRVALRALSNGRTGVASALGYEDFDFPASRRITRQETTSADIIHAHNLHGDYFDLRYLAALSRRRPVVLTLHDMWMLTGHCAYSLGCERWQRGCGECPHLGLYPALERDGTAANWRRKQHIFRASRLYVATPSRWLMAQVDQSMIEPFAWKVIPNGVDLSAFRPTDRLKARDALGLPKDASVLLYAANGAVSNLYKDYTTIEAAVAQVALRWHSEQPLVFLVLGSQMTRQDTINGAVVNYVAYCSDPLVVAQYYQAADIFLHAARADTFPNTVLEAQACGTPVIATAVGGIQEQIENGETGFLTPAGEPAAMAVLITQLLADNAKSRQIGIRAAEHARSRYGLKRQVDEYLTWYQEILARDTKLAHLY